MYTDFQKLQLAVLLPSHEQALQAFKEIPDLNARYKDKYDNILHYIISSIKKENLRVSDFETLIAMGVDVNAKDREGQTPLHYTALYPNPAMAGILINHHADVNAEDNIGNTVLWRAVMDYRGEKNLLDLIILLLNKGADIDKKNQYNISPRGMIEEMKANLTQSNKEWDLSEPLEAYL